MAIDRRVGSLTCQEVLALLSDFIDGDLPDASRREVEVHLAGCDTCERFGGRFAAAVAALRATPAPVSDGAMPEGLRRSLGL